MYDKHLNVIKYHLTTTCGIGSIICCAFYTVASGDANESQDELQSSFYATGHFSLRNSVLLNGSKLDYVW